MFKKGDLIFFNDEGKMLFHYIAAENGIILGGPYLLFENDFESKTRTLEYYAYDLLIQGRLFKEIPEKFLLRVIKNEKNIK